jgi:hypothetical protein
MLNTIHLREGAHRLGMAVSIHGGLMTEWMVWLWFAMWQGLSVCIFTIM